jgi:16S rRNA (cytidine1402-2'-O)-methyltransferase
MTARPSLHVVPTPIGNLKDITIRALEVLKDADLILCEDTRRTRKLLTHYGISRPLVSCERFSEARRLAYVLDRLKEGGAVALVSDAGMPAVSDPGSRVIRRVREEGFPVTVLPGPSALVTAFAASGLAGPFRFVGFLPRKRTDALSEMDAIISSKEATVFYESPRRLAKTLGELSARDPSRFVCVAREITKIHEEYMTGCVSEVLARVEEAGVKGEVTVVVEGAGKAAEGGAGDLDSAALSLLARGVPVKEVVNVLSGLSGLPKRDLYKRLVEMKRGMPGQAQGGHPVRRPHAGSGR